MVYGVLKEFDLDKESIEDFRESFNCYYVANKFRNDGDDVRQKKALFITLLGHSIFLKLEVLANPTSVSNLSMEVIMELLIG